jgi:hypothetical protein
VLAGLAGLDGGDFPPSVQGQHDFGNARVSAHVCTVLSGLTFCVGACTQTCSTA